MDCLTSIDSCIDIPHNISPRSPSCSEPSSRIDCLIESYKTSLSNLLSRLSEEMEEAGYYDMAITMVKSMSKKPRHHSGARNLMFNYFLEHGALIETNEERPIYGLDMYKAREVTTELLGLVADIRSEGRVSDMEALLGKYITTS